MGVKLGFSLRGMNEVLRRIFASRIEKEIKWGNSMIYTYIHVYVIE